MRVQKIFKVGNSWAVTIPPQVVNEHHLELGVYVISQSTSEGFSYKPIRKNTKITKEFDVWLKKTAKKYAPALKELADK